MNASEQLAYDWIRNKFPDLEIDFRSNKSPDFVLSNGEAYEVKRGYLDREGKRHIIESRKGQFEEIINKYPTAILLVVSNTDVLEMPIEEMIGKYEHNGIILHRLNYVKQSLTIREDQAKWVEETSLNLSKFVQIRLDEAMGKKVKYA